MELEKEFYKEIVNLAEKELGINFKKKLRQEAMKDVNERYPRKLRVLCKLANLSPQGFYQNNKKEVKENFSQELIIQELLRYRSVHKRVGVRKLLHQVQSFAMNIGYKIGRDALFELLESHNLLIRNRRKNGPITTFSKHRFKKLYYKGHYTYDAYSNMGFRYYLL